MPKIDSLRKIRKVLKMLPACTPFQKYINFQIKKKLACFRDAKRLIHCVRREKNDPCCICGDEGPDQPVYKQNLIRTSLSLYRII